MEKGLLNSHKEMIASEKRKEAANTTYSRHSAHHAMLKKRGEMPDFAKVLEPPSETRAAMSCSRSSAPSSARCGKRP